MSKHRLEPLADYASLKENDAARRLAACLETLRAKQAELEQLRRYLEEYRRRAERGEAAVDGARWRNLHLFLGRLTEAVAVQEREVDRIRAGFRAASASWQDSRKHAKVLEKLVDRYDEEARKAQERREQAELDEHAARVKS